MFVYILHGHISGFFFKTSNESSENIQYIRFTPMDDDTRCEQDTLNVNIWRSGRLNKKSRFTLNLLEINKCYQRSIFMRALPLLSDHQASMTLPLIFSLTLSQTLPPFANATARERSRGMKREEKTARNSLKLECRGEYSRKRKISRGSASLTTLNATK